MRLFQTPCNWGAYAIASDKPHAAHKSNEWFRINVVLKYPIDEMAIVQMAQINALGYPERNKKEVVYLQESPNS
jgi:hypothetical protein